MLPMAAAAFPEMLAWRRCASRPWLDHFDYCRSHEILFLLACDYEQAVSRRGEGNKHNFSVMASDSVAAVNKFFNGQFKGFGQFLLFPGVISAFLTDGKCSDRLL